MASSLECITWMVVGLTESVTIIVLNSLTVIAFYRNRYLRKRSTYLVISLAVADMLSGVISPLDLFYYIGVTCNFWRHIAENWYQIPAVVTFWFLGCSAVADMLSGGSSALNFFDDVGETWNLWRHNRAYWYIPQVFILWFPVSSLTNMTVISLERLNATFWPFRHRTIKKSVYWVLIIAIWLTALLFSCALIMIQYYTRKWDYYYHACSSFIFICLLVICVSYVFIFVKLRFGNQPRHHGAANRERKLTVTLFTVTSLSLSLLWLPYVITSFLFFCYWHFQFMVWNSVSPFARWFNCLALRKYQILGEL